jgi:hypothetical protein
MGPATEADLLLVRPCLTRELAGRGGVAFWQLAMMVSSSFARGAWGGARCDECVGVAV